MQESPHILKQFIDVVSQPGMLFSFDPVAGYTGLLLGKRPRLSITSIEFRPKLGHPRRSYRPSRSAFDRA